MCGLSSHFSIEHIPARVSGQCRRRRTRGGFAGCSNLFNLWLGPGMSTMRRRYRSRQRRLARWQSVIATSERANESPFETIAAPLPGQSLMLKHLVWAEESTSIYVIHLMSFCAISWPRMTYSKAFVSEDLTDVEDIIMKGSFFFKHVFLKKDIMKGNPDFKPIVTSIWHRKCSLNSRLKTFSLLFNLATQHWPHVLRKTFK